MPAHIPLKLWPNTAQGCNHQSTCMPQLQPCVLFWTQQTFVMQLYAFMQLYAVKLFILYNLWRHLRDKCLPLAHIYLVVYDKLYVVIIWEVIRRFIRTSFFVRHFLLPFKSENVPAQGIRLIYNYLEHAHKGPSHDAPQSEYVHIPPPDTARLNTYCKRGPRMWITECSYTSR